MAEEVKSNPRISGKRPGRAKEELKSGDGTVECFFFLFFFFIQRVVRVGR